MHLVSPSIHYKASYLAALAEAQDERDIIEIYTPREDQTFAEYIDELHAHAKGLELPLGWVSETIFWLVDNDAFIGRASIRHTLNDQLLTIGGHIGYFIRPSMREKGYGKMILKLALIEAKKIGLTRVLVTCDVTNPGSRKIIEANGGVFENIVENGPNMPPKRRYWIKI